MRKTIAALMLLALGLSATAHVNNYFHKHDIVTMDVVKTYGGGGTYLCKSVRDCYIRTIYAEERGARQYCESVTIKRNGKVVWQRRYADIYTPSVPKRPSFKTFPYPEDR